MRNRIKRILYIAVSLLIIYLYNTIIEPNLNESYSNVVTSDLKVYFFDVGQADSILIVNNGQSMLIDGGNNDDGDLIVNNLKKIGITKSKNLIFLPFNTSDQIKKTANNFHF